MFHYKYFSGNECKTIKDVKPNFNNIFMIKVIKQKNPTLSQQPVLILNQHILIILAEGNQNLKSYLILTNPKKSAFQSSPKQTKKNPTHS